MQKLPPGWRKLSRRLSGCSLGWAARKSTHTFMLHLADCSEGGETVFLTHINRAPNLKDNSEPEPEPEREQEQDDGVDDSVLGSALPQRGRLVVFPHACPHAGLAVVDVPKRFLRGELLIS